MSYVTSESAPDQSPPATPRSRWASGILASGPFRFGFVTTLGVLLALLLGAAVVSLSYAITLLFLAIFISLGLYPVVTRLQDRGVSKTGAILIVLAGFIAIVVTLVLLLTPIVIEQATELITTVPSYLTDIENQPWFVNLDTDFGGALTTLLVLLNDAISDPNTWVVVSGGVLAIGASIVNTVFGIIFVVVMTLYCVSALDQMKGALYELVPASQRAGFRDLAEEIFDSIGKYLIGQIVLAAINATFSFILLTILGVRYAVVLAFVALFITLIPIIGPVISTTIMTVVTLFESPVTALIVAIVMIVYMQVESYVLTPRVIGKAISIPSALVLIAAFIGASLLGLLGALVAAPLVASILLIVKKVVVPRQNLK
jgi:predicted PurR-regulated permease PerM